MNKWIFGIVVYGLLSVISSAEVAVKLQDIADDRGLKDGYEFLGDNYVCYVSVAQIAQGYGYLKGNYEFATQNKDNAEIILQSMNEISGYHYFVSREMFDVAIKAKKAKEAMNERQQAFLSSEIQKLENLIGDGCVVDYNYIELDRDISSGKNPTFIFKKSEQEILDNWDTYFQ